MPTTYDRSREFAPHHLFSIPRQFVQNGGGRAVNSASHGPGENVFLSAMATRVLIAFDKFKDALPAPEACAIAAREIARAHPDWVVEICPLTDGGDGFCSILTAAAGGETHWIDAPGPFLEMRRAPIGLVSSDRVPVAALEFLAGDTAARKSRTLALVEMAAISGLALVELAARDLWNTTTSGTGALLRAAAEAGADMIVLGIGGSATHDLGLGALEALGLEFLDQNGAVLKPPVPARWQDIVAIRGTVIPNFPPIAIAVDVQNPLLGPHGAAATFGPQKGLRRADIGRLDEASERIARMLCAHCERDPDIAMTRPGSGAAGGLGFGLAVASGAQFVAGSDLVAAWLALDERIERADIVITGEGRWDAGSLAGKGPGDVVRRTRARDRRAIVLAGSVDEKSADDADTHAITPPGTSLVHALAQTCENLAAAMNRVLG